MNIDLKEEFEIIENGVKYRIPEYEVIDNIGIKLTEVNLTNNGEAWNVPNPIEIRFVRGSKLGEEIVEKKKGTLHEHLLSVMIHDLKFKHNLVPSKEGAMTITKLEEALHWLRARQIDRAKRDVIGTYKK